MEQVLTPMPGRRLIPQLPADIPIMPGEIKAAKAARRLPAGLIIFLAVVALGVLVWLSNWYSDYDQNRVDPVLTRAVLARVPRGTRLPVTLWSGPRILQIEYAFPNRGQTLATCVTADVLDPKTGAKDPKYPSGTGTCIEGVTITIR